MRHLATSITVLALAGLALAAVASAQTYPPSGCELQVSTSVVEPGESFIAEGCGFEPRTEVTFTLERSPGVVLGVASANANGEVRAELTIPERTTPGRYTLHARGAAEGGGTLDLEAGLTVALATVAGSEEELASTGLRLAPIAAAGLLLVAAGASLLLARRRRA